MRKSAGEERFITLGMSRETYRDLKHVSVDMDTTIPKLLKKMIADLIATHVWAHQPVVGDLSDLVSTDVPNGAETQDYAQQGVQP
jgi:hypothetical protein